MLDQRLVRELKQARAFLLLTIGSGVTAGLLTVLQASYFARVVNHVFLQKLGLVEVWPGLLFLLGVILLRSLVSWLTEVFAHRTAARIKEDLRQRVLAHLLALGPIFARGERTGELVNVLVEGIEALEAYFARYLPQLAIAALVPLLILSFVFPLDLLTGVIMLVTAPLIPVFMILIGKLAEHLTQKQWNHLSRMSAHFLDVLQGLTTLKIFGRSKAQLEVIARISDRFRDTTLGVLRVAFLSALVLELLSTLSTAVVAVALGLRLVYGQIPFEQAFFLLLLAPEFYMPLRLLGSHYHAGMSGANAAERIYELLAHPLPGELKISKDQLAKDLQPRVVFKGVNYAYEDGEHSALGGVSFQLLPGERVALVGPSGSGKSTIAHLLLRFIEPSQGTITVNGISLAEISPEEWMEYLAFVPQHPHLFCGTVGENIGLGKLNASREEIMAAAKFARAHDFISQLPLGYDTPLGEGGRGLSGGQAQRIAVARAFLKDAPLLVLDEATAGLDPETEKELQDSLEALLSGRTVLIIAHRLSTVCRADRILVLDRGKLVEKGTHSELLQQQGLYYKLATAHGGVA